MGNDEMNDGNALYWVWFTLALGYSNPKADMVYSAYKDISVFYNGKEFEWRLCGFFNNNELKKLVSTDLGKAQAVLDRCKALEIDIITIEDERYPENLRYIDSPPAALYVKGRLPQLTTTLSIAVVGTRKPTRYGIKNAFDCSYNLAKYGAVVVSGGALGIDSAAHNGALKAEGVTVCVLGCGINSSYLRQNITMRNAIAEKGALVSEYPPDTPPAAYMFPARNRIISGLSQGVTVIEAGKKSGALITASRAIEQGKDVFALMGNVDSPMSAGTNALIKDGAVPISGFRDILNHFPSLYSVPENSKEFHSDDNTISAIPVKGSLPAVSDGKIVKPAEKSDDKPAEAPKLDGIKLQIYNALGSEIVHIDELAAALSKPLYELLPAVTELEIAGIITEEKSRCYKRK